MYYMLGEQLPANNHYDNLKKAELYGFKISVLQRSVLPYKKHDFINYWDFERKNLPVATDGIVRRLIHCYSRNNWVLRQNLRDELCI